MQRVAGTFVPVSYRMVGMLFAAHGARLSHKSFLAASGRDL